MYLGCPMKNVVTCLLSFCILCCSTFAQPRFPQRQLKTSADIALALEKLNTVGSVLYLAAHPDDENTRLIGWLANERKVRTGYLSLTRGDGGQNLIGTEQGEELGLLRTQELLEARKVDGGEQFFTRAKDFGYSKNPEESFEIWGKEVLLADVVWVIRKFRPDVVICRFPTTGEGGHGHHTASAILANEAYKLAADPTAFPEQLNYVKTWQVKRVLWNSFSWNRKPGEQYPGEIKVDAGAYNPLLGISYGEMAAIARSKHRCQGFGSRLARGEVPEFVKNILGDSITTDILENLDLSWNRIEGGSGIGTKITAIRKQFDPTQPEKIVSELLAIRQQIFQLKDEHWRKLKLAEIDEIILACCGVFLDAHTAASTINPGAKLEVNIEAINRSNTSFLLDKVALNGVVDTVFNKPLVNNQFFSAKRATTVPTNLPLSQPYWLAMPEQKGTYEPKDSQKVDWPENEPATTATFYLNIAGTMLEVNKPIWHKEIDPSVGEVYQPLVVSPPVVFELPKNALMWVNAPEKEFSFSVQGMTDSAIVTVKLNLPKGVSASWTEKEIRINKAGEKVKLTVSLRSVKNNDLPSGVLSLEAMVNGVSYSYTKSEVKYPHIYNQAWFPAAVVTICPLKIAGNTGLIGYIPGAGDEVVECLTNIGFSVKNLTEQDLLTSDLSVYKAIICGIRAYNTNEKMALYQPILNKYVENGGTYIVQYQTNNFLGTVKSSIAPLKLTLGRERVTKEEAEVKILNPAFTGLNQPNKITATDFNNWVQERGIYFAAEWDSTFVPLFEMNDPGEKTQQGSTLYAKFGKGQYFYTGLAFFRQLPAGNAGAYRLLTNFINIGYSK